MARPKMTSAFAAPGAAELSSAAPQPTPIVRPSDVPAPAPNPREGQINVVVGAERHRQLKVLAASRGVKMRDLVMEAINILFERYNLPPVRD